MRVFYLTGTQFALSNISLQRLKIARFADLNDPFELLAVDLADKRYRAAFRNTKEQINRDRGLMCFSKSWRNPLLWGHYAEKHAGMCLGFDVPDKLLASVIYAKTPMKVRVDTETDLPILNERVTNRLIRTKFYDWSYEEEVRLFAALDHDMIESGNYFYSFSSELKLREVILGPRCEVPIDAVRNLLERFDNSVSVVKSRIAFSSFSVVENRAASKKRRKA